MQASCRLHAGLGRPQVGRKEGKRVVRWGPPWVLSHRTSGFLIAFPAEMPRGVSTHVMISECQISERQDHHKIAKKNRGGQPRGSMPFWVAADLR